MWVNAKVVAVSVYQSMLVAYLNLIGKMNSIMVDDYSVGMGEDGF